MEKPIFFTPIPTVQQQIKLYLKAYKPFNKRQFNPKITHIPGLEQILRIAYSYTFLLISNREEKIVILKKFWKETEEDIKSKVLTISHFKKINLRLALLVVYKNKVALYSERLPLLQFLKDPNINWQDLDLYSNECIGSDVLSSYSYPLCFEAIIYYQKGELDINVFLKCFLEYEITLGVSVFPSISTGGPHGGYVADSASFLVHDFVHWSGFANQFKKNGEVWPYIKSIISKITKCKIFDIYTQVILFILLHEVYPNVEVLFTPKGNTIIDILDYNLNKKDDEVLQFSERLIFKRWIGLAINEFYKVFNLVEGPASIFFESIYFAEEILERPYLKSINKIDEAKDLYKATLCAYFLPSVVIIQNNNELNIDSKKLFLDIESIISFKKTENSDFELVTLEKLQSLSIVHEENKLKDLFLKSSNKYKIVNKQYKYDSSSLLQLINDSVINKSKKVVSRNIAFKVQVLDLIKLFNIGNKKKLPYDTSLKLFKKNLEQFLWNFYIQNKSILSNKPVKVPQQFQI